MYRVLILDERHGPYHGTISYQDHATYPEAWRDYNATGPDSGTDARIVEVPQGAPFIAPSVEEFSALPWSQRP